MDGTQLFFLIFTVLGGLALFILGMGIMSDGLRVAAGAGLRTLLTMATANRFAGLALGTLLPGAATLGIDACPMEGFDQNVLDEELGLRARGFTSSVIVSLGYSSAEDFNAKLPKSRLPLETVLTRL